MKFRKLFLLNICLAFVFSLRGQVIIDVPENQVPLVTKISASWCPNCGAWGWDLMEGLMEDNQAFANLFTAHYSGDYRTDVGAALIDNFGAIGQPDFFLDADRIAVSPSNASTVRTELKQSIAQRSALNPIAQTGLVAGTTEDQFMVFTKTRFFQQAEGEFFLSLYLLEKTFVGPQQGRGSEALHKNLLRMNLTEEIFGSPIAEGAISPGTEVELDVALALSDMPYQLDNITIFSIIWEKKEGKFEVVNTNAALDVINGLVLNSSRPARKEAADFSVSIQPNVINDVAKLEIILPSQRNRFAVEVWSIDGKKIDDVYTGPLPAGKHSWRLDRSKIDHAGLYIVRFHDDKHQHSEKVIFR